MEKAKILEQLISKKNLSLKAFAEKCNIPYTTLYTILKNGAGKANVNNVILICKELGISVEQLDDLSKNIDNNTKESDSDTYMTLKPERKSLKEILAEEDKKHYAKIAGYGSGVKTIEINKKQEQEKYYALIKDDEEGYKRIDMTKDEFLKINDILNIMRK